MPDVVLVNDIPLGLLALLVTESAWMIRAGGLRLYLLQMMSVPVGAALYNVGVRLCEATA